MLKQPNSTPSQQSKTFLKPIEFLNTIKDKTNTLFSKTKPQTIFTAKHSTPKSYLKHPTIQLTQKKKIFSSISKRKIPLTSVYIKNDLLFLGDAVGNMYMYLYNNEINKQQFKSPDRRSESDLSVKRIDISDNGQYLLAGFPNGDIDLWEINNKKLIYTVKSVHTSEITALKFLSITNNNQFEFISCDNSGNIYKVNITVGFLGYKQTVTVIEKNALCAFFSIDINKLYLETSATNVKNNNAMNMSNLMSNVTNLMNAVSGVNVNFKNVYICVFCSNDKVVVKYIDKEIYQIEEFPKPDYVSENDICPDVAIGKGGVPDNTVMSNLFGTSSKTQSKPKKSTKPKKENFMLAISWGNIIFFYIIDVKDILNGGLIKINTTPCGNFKYQTSIIRIGFLAPSLLFIINKDREKKLIVINTTQIPPGESAKQADHLYKRAITETCPLIDSNLYANEIIDKKTGMASYSYKDFILYGDKCIYFISENNLYSGELFTYEHYIQTLIDKEDWDSTLRLAIDLYKGKLHSFPNLPVDDKERKEYLQPYMEELLQKYISYICNKIKAERERGMVKEIELDFGDDDINNNNNNNNSNNNDSSQMKQIDIILGVSMNNAIDYCLQFENADFIFSNLLKMYVKQGYNDKFVKALEPFIFDNKLKDLQLSEQSILALFTAYLTNKEYNLLSHLSTHINVTSLNIPIIKMMCLKFSLFHTMCYIFNTDNNNNKEIFSLIENMFICFTNKNQNLKTTSTTFDIFSYNDIYVNKGLDYIENTAEYAGHYLLWYIHSIITNYNLYSIDLIIKIYIWLLSQKVFLVLVSFDSYSLFQLIEKIFLQDVIKNKLIHYDHKKIEDILKKYPPVKLSENHLFKAFHSVPETVNYIVAVTERFANFYGKLDMYMFIIQMSIRNSTIIIKDKILNAMINVLSLNKKMKKHSHEELYDKFYQHGIRMRVDSKQITINESEQDASSLQSSSQVQNEQLNVKIESIDDQYIKEISTKIINLITSDFDLDESEISQLIKVCEYSPFLLVVIALLQVSRKYADCLDIFIQNANEIGSEKIFDWINEMLLKFKNDDNEQELNNFKNELMSKLTSLAKINISKVKRLINNLYTNSQKVIIIQQLNNPKIQLDFVEMILNEVNSKASLYMNNEKSNLENTEIKQLLMLQLQLLIKLGLQEKILPCIKKRYQYYSIEESIQVCLDNEIYDACIYLYKLNHQNEKALQIAMKVMDIQYEVMINSNDDNVNANINVFNDAFNACIQICEDCSDKVFHINDEIDDNDNNNTNNANNSSNGNNNNTPEDDNNNNNINMKIDSNSIWFMLLEKIYKYHSDKDKEYAKEVYEYKSKLLETLLEKMCLYVHVRQIIDDMVTKYKDVEIKEFKTLLKKIFCSFNKLSTILTSVKQLIGTSIYIHVADYMKKNQHGTEFTTKVCSYCNKKIDYDLETNSYLLLFSCGHILHSSCGKKTLVFGKHPICIACKQNEIDESVANDFQGRGEYRKLTYFGRRKGKGRRGREKSVKETDGVKNEELSQEDK